MDKNIKNLIIILVAIVFIGFAQDAKSIVLTFDDIGSPPAGWGLVPDGYGGLDWDNMGYVNKKRWRAYTSVSGNYSAYNDNGQPAYITGNSQNSHFNLNSLYAGTLRKNTTVTVKGYRDNNLIYEDSYTFKKRKKMEFFELGYQNVDYLEFQSSKRDLMIDNMDVTPVPEQTTLALGIMGIAGLFGVKRKRKQFI